MSPQGTVRNPQLQADLSVFSAADALQWAGTSELTGRLEFDGHDGRITLLFERGRLLHAEAQDRRAAFGRHLFAEGLVDEVDLAAASVYAHDNQKRLGGAMVELGILSEEEVEPELERHTLNLASIPLAWPEGLVTATLSASETLPTFMTDPVEPTHLLMETARRLDETRTMRRLLPHDGIRLASSGKAAAGTSPREQRVLDLIEPGSTLGGLYDRIGGSYFEYLESVHRLVEEGLIEVDPPVERQASLSSELRGTGS